MDRVPERSNDSAATGGCLCGAVRFAITAPIAAAAYCHCTDCRRVTGSAFNISVGVQLAAFTLTGTPTGHTSRAESGAVLARHFCGACGSPLYTSSDSAPERIFVKAGALDDPDLIEPADQSWTRSQVARSVIPTDLPAHTRDRSAGSTA